MSLGKRQDTAKTETVGDIGIRDIRFLSQNEGLWNVDIECGLRMQDGGKIQSFASLGLANRRAQQPAKKTQKRQIQKRQTHKRQTQKRQTQKDKHTKDKYKKNKHKKDTRKKNITKPILV